MASGPFSNLFRSKDPLQETASYLFLQCLDLSQVAGNQIKLCFQKMAHQRSKIGCFKSFIFTQRKPTLQCLTPPEVSSGSRCLVADLPAKLPWLIDPDLGGQNVTCNEMFQLFCCFIRINHQRLQLYNIIRLYNNHYTNAIYKYM